MSEIRRDPINNRWVIYSSERNRRPTDFSSRRQPFHDEPHLEHCPFCIGNERMSSHHIRQYDAGDGQGWRVRVVANKFPALRVEEELDKRGDGIYDRINGLGAHEVIIETPLHNESLPALSLDHFTLVLTAYRDRIADLTRDKRFRYILVFKNYGAEAGGTLEHGHSQLIALPFVPRQMEDELEGVRRYYHFKERPLFMDLVRQELADRVRVVEENELFLAVCPYASRFPFEIWVLPKTHRPRYEKLDDGELKLLARLFGRVLRKLDHALDRPAYNFMLHNAPPPAQGERTGERTFHWHFEIIPKVTHVAGFEWGSGCYINPTLPEDAAAFLRDLDAEG